jgi:uncharacterized protein (DUF362 family)
VGNLGGFNVIGAPASSSSGKIDMVGVKGGEPGEMFDKAIAELGGMGKFVKRGQSVVVKPNMGWSRTPESAANTNPDLVKRIVEHCLKAGAKSVHIFDHTCNSWRDCYEKSGMNEVAAATGAKLVTGNHSNDYREIDVPKGKRLKKAKMHRLILDSDVFINVPVLKNHGGAVMTCAMKNLMGIVWDRGYFHKNNLQQCIADFVTARKPDLNIIDGYRVMKKGGPRGHNLRDVEMMKYLIVTTDIVAADTAASKVIGIPIERIKHIELGEELGLGTTALDTLNIKRIDMSKKA